MKNAQVFRDDGQVFKCSSVQKCSEMIDKCSSVQKYSEMMDKCASVQKCSEMIDSPKLAISRSKDSDHAWISLKVKELKTFELFDR